ncbi:DUF2911 domain-containing protein [Galbibacter sp. EGI 63066]|uniref:DUF2911 domain-containing protein n=1 Tax=Galbibacter sp. EGI 63066 TaxID=2993559 RepID=UPI002249906E|nr:DUF2911 domain-containing protein [Galbibacter sp. EGI 63066]MCX2679563.1 DUF2911 domain-containing protein [Galbibacter sp. EGI 63066]
MKKIITCMLFVAALTFTTESSAQKFSGLDKSPADIAYLRTERSAPPLVKIIYSRPQLKGRLVGVDLAPHGDVWRTGANETTEIKFYQDMTFGGETITAGTYSLFTIPGKSEWTIILNKDLDTWGAYSYNEANDVARITVPASTGGKSLEAFSITFAPDDNGGKMIMGWDKVRVEVPIATE